QITGKAFEKRDYSDINSSIETNVNSFVSDYLQTM
ncbi:MAG: hypothetical protein ACI8ZN_001227, partial [Bacteroidia bacterium]